MLDAIELWQVPLLVAGTILVGYLVYAGIAKSSRIRAQWIKFLGLIALGLLLIVIIIQLIRRDEIASIVTLIAAAVEGCVAWVTYLELKELRLARAEKKGINSSFHGNSPDPT